MTGTRIVSLIGDAVDIIDKIVERMKCSFSLLLFDAFYSRFLFTKYASLDTALVF